MTAMQPASMRVGIAGTVVAHGVLLALLLLSIPHAAARGPLVYEVNLVAAPAAPPAVRKVEPAVPPPAPTKAVVKVTPPKTSPKVKSVSTTKPVAAPPTKAPVAPAPGEKPGTGSDVVSLQQAGVSFPYPEYLQKIENQIFARWAHDMFRAGLEARVAFVIQKDGSVDEKSIHVTRSSGNSSFDQFATAAVESAGSTHAFGPLPSGFDAPSLPILFTFTQVAK
jgi:outer membrane biosynthesis protein TonB